MDTRPGAILTGAEGPFLANGPRRLDPAGHWGAPLSAQAVTGNLTVVNQTAAGYVSATLTSEPDPTTSILNFPLGDTRANGVTLPLNAGGRTWFVYKAPSGKSTHLILDLSGYLTSPTTGHVRFRATTLRRLHAPRVVPSAILDLAGGG